MIRIDSVVIVEGKYDKIALQSFIDATIVTTNGFGIFRDKGKRELIKLLCEKHGAVIITDSDNAGMQIRSYIKSFCNSDRIINVYIPQIPGKERRKTVPSKQGFLGVEGIDRDTVISALQRSGVNLAAAKVKTKISKTDLYVAGLSGKKDSRMEREDFLRFITLPVGMSANAFLDALNALYSVDEFNSEVEKWRQAQV